jgi:Fe-S-cluster containining protein
MDGVRFTCQPGCVRCCDRPGAVYLSEEDSPRIAAFLGLSQADFENRYVYRTRHQMRLRKPPRRQCRFLDPEGCSIHPVKPAQCRLFPFWPEIVESSRGWSAAGRWCPGIGQGPLVQIGTALETASEMKRAYPRQYPPPKS